MVLTWCLTDIPKPFLPSPIEYGWKDANEDYEGVMRDEIPAPGAIIQMTTCGCSTEC